MPVNTTPAYPSSPASPDTPNTPKQLYSTSTSPALSASPSTPPGFVDANICIASHSTYGTPHAIEQDSVAAVVPLPLQKQVSRTLSQSNVLESIPTKESLLISTTSSTGHSSSHMRNEKITGEPRARKEGVCVPIFKAMITSWKEETKRNKHVR
ncbi:hypothetical protein EVJ58_g8447 [Rhodofomes roseus]|uniref:Uncharacterized protein n=1 Tax=Rhodofomes roseus TaxID=34475 RepID=A0A4Y9XZ87_9APHY|nr:hypothetical protein EVJ58_g8447 [Rhodofomes roseus]